ncbi:hypothetical protein C8F04DRAFT_1252185 [Mycena alexandri]|uniref:Uncharacterized protein n=1 Tax=Mycena alexandri TaxID=1745969 RepID=A0AAD6T9W5_9AGAR|nr:hypothetical protein C8F04DRAFT_1252185 [Mycena alexandri]
MSSAGAVKLEVRSPAIKREAVETVAKRKAEMQSPSSVANTPVQGGSRRAPRARKAPILSYTRSSSDDDVESVDSDFFFLPDSPTPAAAKGQADRDRSPEGTAVVGAAAEDEGAPPSRATSPTMSSASSLAASTVPPSNADAEVPSKADAKGKGRAVPRTSVVASSSRMQDQPAALNTTLHGDRLNEASASSISRVGVSAAFAGTSAAAASISQVGRNGVPSGSRAPSRGDIFYVSARGAVHYSREQAFRDIDVGPIQPVVGYDAALTYADKLVLAEDRGDGVTTMDFDAA